MGAIPAPSHVQEVVAETVARFGEQLHAVLWIGSSAVGDATSASDQDLAFIFHAIDDDVLLGLQQVFANRSRDDWSVSIVGKRELAHLPEQFRLRFTYGYRVLYGDYAAPALSRESLAGVIGLLAQDLSHLCRTRFVFNRPKATKLYRALKKAVVAMRVRHLLQHGYFPETRAELHQLVDDETERTIIDWVIRWPEVRAGFKEDPQPLMLRIHAFASRLLAAPPEA